MKSTQLKKCWIDFFVKHGHYAVESQSLIPKNDDSILWINSGVATLKDYFTGHKKPPKKSLVNYQRSIRTNDIENVGLTARHHTFFEMLGNFSIGGYFKSEAIKLAFDFLLNELKLNKNNLYITYFEEDHITKKLLLQERISDSHIIPGNKTTNFWDLGSGPCGPNMEIFYDRGEKYDPKKIGIQLLIDDIENDRYIEIWNIVFSQFNNDSKGNYIPLAQKNIDTGAGFERLLSILQNVPTNYDTDLFEGIINSIEKLCNKKYKINNYFLKDKNQQTINKNFKIILDHIRTATLAINDGATPSNIGRGYIIRRLIRRAYRTGIQLGIKKTLFLHRLVSDVATSLPEYDIDIKRVSSVIEKEEIQFSKRINLGEKLFNKTVKDGKFNATIVFKLFETFGFPIELTKELAAEKGLTFDEKEVKKLFKEHQAKSKSMKNKGMSDQIIPLQNIEKNYTVFTGYEKEAGEGKILFLFNKKENLKYLTGEGMIIADKTPFYATKGGQNHDFGIITQGNNIATIIDVFIGKEGNHIHLVNVKGKLKIGLAHFQLDHKGRDNSARNHSSTHLVYSALLATLGIGIFQLGSDNNQERLKFDFPLDHLLTFSEISKVEKFVNNVIKENIRREYILTNYENAKRMNALGLPKSTIRGDVRVVKFGNVSIELCGGTHVKSTREIEMLFITKVESKGAGIYRLEAITSIKTINQYFDNKYEWLQQKHHGLLKKIYEIDSKYKTKIKINSVSNREELLREENKIEELFNEFKVIRKKKKNEPQIIKSDIKSQIIGNIKVFIDLENIQLSQLRDTATKYKVENGNAIIILGVPKAKQIILIIASQKFDSNKILKNILKLSNGKGGGAQTIAQGMCDAENIKSIIKRVISEI